MNRETAILKLRRNWVGMWDRCTDLERKSYVNYGGRGIYVSDEWEEFLPFRDWALSNGYDEGLQLDRIDNDGPYAPWNCRYVTPRENSLNRRSTVWIEAFGERKCLTDWVDDPRCVTDQRTLSRRIQQFGWIPEEAITLKSRKDRTRMCSKGLHLLTEKNTYKRSNGSRLCAECQKATALKRYYAVRDELNGNSQ